MRKRPSLFLAIDQGTHASKAVLFDEAGRALHRGEQPLNLTRLDASRVEQDASEILSATRAVIDAAVATAQALGATVEAAGLATQRSTVVAWDADSGKPLCPALSWQDTRAAAELIALRPQSDAIAAATGLRLSPHYGASKMRWLLAHQATVQDAAAAGRLRIGPLAAFLLDALVDGRPYVVDQANAARSLLMHLDRRDWDAGLLALFDLDQTALPRIQPIRYGYGQLAGHDIPLQAVNGDQGAAVLGNGGGQSLTANFGTGAFLLGPPDTLARRHTRLLSTLIDSDAHSAAYSLEGTVNGAGAALDWLARQDSPTDIGKTQAWPERQTLLFLNTVGSLGSPWWRSGIAPRFLGDASTSDASQRHAAVLESILFMAKANLDLIRAQAGDGNDLRVSGGLTHIAGLMNRLASLMDRPVDVSLEAEATCRGIAWQAAGMPAWETPPVRRIEPCPDAGLKQRYARFLEELDSASSASAQREQ